MKILCQYVLVSLCQFIGIHRIITEKAPKYKINCAIIAFMNGISTNAVLSHTTPETEFSSMIRSILVIGDIVQFFSVTACNVIFLAQSVDKRAS